MKKIRIKKLPKANMGTEVRNQVPYIDNTASPNLGLGDIGSNPPIEVNSTLRPVPRDEANLEAEVGETAITDLNSDGLPEFYKIGGKKHSKGGTPLNLPNNSFIYSNDKSLRIKDPELLKQFGKGGNKKKKGYTPAELSKTYDINKFRKVLADPNSDKLSIETAEKMIKNYMDKLGALALVQESMKGFENGIPAVAQPYLQKIGVSSEDILPPPPEAMQQQAMQQMPQQQMAPQQMMPQAKYGMDTGNPGNPFPVQRTYIDPTSRKKTKGLQNFVKRKYANDPMFRAYADKNLMPQGNLYMGEVDPVTEGTEYIEKYVDPTNMREDNTIYLSDQALFDEQGNRVDPQYLQGDMQFIPTSKRQIRRDFRDFKKAENEMPRYQDGGDVESNKPTKKQNLPDGATVYDADSPDFDPKKLKEGNYVKRNGKYYKVGKKKFAEYDGPAIDKLDSKLKGEYGDMREAYGRLVKKFNTDADVKKSFLQNFDKEISNLKPGDGIYSQADIEKLKGLSDQQKIDYFLNGNKHHMMIAAQMGDVTNIDNVGAWDKGRRDASGIPSNYKSAIGQAGLKPMSIDQTLGFQAGYIALQKMYDDPDVKDKLKNFRLPKTGVGDEGAAGSKFISKADGWEGNTTAGEMVLWAPNDYTFEEEEVPFEEEKKKEEKEIKGIEDPKPEPYTPYWTQDLRNVAGSLYDLATVKKRSPWQAKPQMNLAQPTFADFRGAASRLGSMAQSGAQQLATFGTPQAFGAGFANMQRNLAQNIGQLQDQEYKTNVGTANQFEMANTDIKNKYGVLQAKMATDLYDKETIADQAYDNSKRALRWNAIQSMNQADTNRGMTQTANTLTPNRYLDPRTGFTSFRDDGTQITATNKGPSVQEQVLKNAQRYMEDNPGMDWSTATKIASTGINKKTTSTAANNQNAVSGYPGYPMNPTGRRRRQSSNQRYMHGGAVPKKKCRVLRLPNK
jgi:hypothetical protein